MGPRVNTNAAAAKASRVPRRSPEGFNTLAGAGASVPAQANAVPQTALQLLR